MPVIIPSDEPLWMTFCAMGNNVWIDNKWGQAIFRVRRKNTAIEEGITDARQAVEIAQEFIVAHLRLKG